MNWIPIYWLVIEMKVECINWSHRLCRCHIEHSQFTLFRNGRNCLTIHLIYSEERRNTTKKKNVVSPNAVSCSCFMLVSFFFRSVHMDSLLGMQHVRFLLKIFDEFLVLILFLLLHVLFLALCLISSFQWKKWLCNECNVSSRFIEFFVF